jgi:sn-glycerol 3-phosphate transport system permease protein
MQKRVRFDRRRVGYFFLLPQILILTLFFYWPSAQAVWQSLTIADPWSGRADFVGWLNFERLFGREDYWRAFWVTLVFSGAVTLLSLALGIVLATFADRLVRTRPLYHNLLIWPYAVAPVVAGAFWLFLLQPYYGVLATMLLKPAGIDWRPHMDGSHALILVIVASSWKAIAYNFVFFLAALQAIPRSLIEAAAMDGAGPLRRFVDLIMPLASPTLFFLVVINVVNALFDNFSLIHAITQGGPLGATTVLVYKVYRDGFEGLDLGLSSAQSVVLMILVVGLTILQFKLMERRVQYAS